MTKIFVDDDVPWSWTPEDPNFVPPTIRKLLSEEFSPEADFYVCDGRPYVVYPQWDYATDWSEYPIREVHPFHPVLNGKKITQAEFRTLVKAAHWIT
jgi:hypothetical protein